MKRILLSAILPIAFVITCIAQPLPGRVLRENLVSSVARTHTDFPLVSTAGKPAPLCYDSNDYPGVVRAVGDLQTDITAVTGQQPQLPATANGTSLVIIGTLGRSSLITQLVKAGKLVTTALTGKRESFVITTIPNPLPGVTQALVIAGSDQRGTIYGIYELSTHLGVSPWHWWADVPVTKRKAAYVKAGRFLSGEPAVRYRGIFINDEDWGLKPWAAKNYEKELGDIGPATYARVCELLLRLKANMLAPAMHSCTGAFYSHAESKLVADRYGILITTSHCEPLLFNNAARSEWDSKLDGEWNYATNTAAIRTKLDNRVKEAAPFENIYTVGMRGLHDEGMKGNLSDAEKVRVLGQAITDQRAILQKYISKPLSDIPQIFVPYKEALDVYNLGLQVPEDVTLVWTDDNYGYMKRLSTPEEQKRSGGSGVYYHTSYLGAPHDYLWLNTTPPVLMYEELKKAWNTGADRYWLLNVGDIKPAELAMQTFFDLAWNMPQYNYANIHRHQSRFLASLFGAGYEKDLQYILDNHYRLACSRKPEFMGWEREWDAAKYRELAPTAFSFQHYNDAQQRLADYDSIANLSAQLLKRLPQSSQAAFFELVAYPVMGAYQMNRKFLYAQLNAEQLQQNNPQTANWAATQSKAAFDSIEQLNTRYNQLLNGKWNGMMMIAPGFVASYQNMPKVVLTETAGTAAPDLLPRKNTALLQGCTVLDLTKYKKKTTRNGHTLRLVEGVGYDWNAIQLGEAGEPTADAGSSNTSSFEYAFSGVNADSVTVQVYTLPFFPLHKGKSTRYGIAIDGGTPVLAQNNAIEFTETWKDRVLRNGALTVVKLPVNKNLSEHTIRFTCGDPGIMIQRVILDWGGLQNSYVGPAVSLGHQL